MPVTMIAAFMHDFEVERVRIQQAKENKGGTGGDIFQGHEISNIDDRIPLAVRGKPFIEWVRWINAWNVKNPDEKIAVPDRVYRAKI